MHSNAKLSPMAQIVSVPGRFMVGSPSFKPKAARVAKKTTKASKLRTIDASALFDDLLFFNVSSFLNQTQHCSD